MNDVQAGHQTGRHTILAGYQFWRDDVDDVIPACSRWNAGNVTDNFQPDLDRGPNRDFRLRLRPRRQAPVHHRHNLGVLTFPDPSL